MGVGNMNESTLETCIICEQRKKKGIHLYTSFICIDCEKEMLQTDTNDPKYQYFIKRLKCAAKPEIFS